MIRFIALFFAVSNLAFASDLTKLQESADLALKHWQESNVQNYSFVFKRYCECMGPQSARVTIENGKVTKVVDPTDSTVDLFNNVYLHETVDSFLDMIQKSLKAKPANARFTFDAEYGYPTEISIDPNERMVDDEVSYTLSDFLISP